MFNRPRVRDLKTRFEERINEALGMSFYVDFTDFTAYQELVLGSRGQKDLEKALEELQKNNDGMGLRGIVGLLNHAVERLRTEFANFPRLVRRYRYPARTDAERAQIIADQRDCIGEIVCLTAAINKDLDAYIKEVVTLNANSAHSQQRSVKPRV